METKINITLEIEETVDLLLKEIIDIQMDKIRDSERLYNNFLKTK